MIGIKYFEFGDTKEGPIIDQELLEQTNSTQFFGFFRFAFLLFGIADIILDLINFHAFVLI